MRATITTLLRRLAPRRGPARLTHVARLVATSLVLLVVAAGCGDSSTGPRGIEGTYSLREVDGIEVPFTQSGVTLNSGTLDLEDGDWRLTFRTSEGSDGDEGTYEQSGSTVFFDSSVFFDSFEGDLSNDRRTLRVLYDFSGEGTDFTELVFQR